MKVYSQPLRPKWGSFFKSRNRLYILCGMHRTGADMRKAKLLEHAPDRDFRQINAKALPKDALQVHTSPTYHSILLRIRAGLYQLPQCLLLFG